MAEKTMKMWGRVPKPTTAQRPHRGSPQGKGAYGMKPQI